MHRHNIIFVSFSQISYLASCPCLSDRFRYPNFFRTIPSDVYRARAMARLAVRFNWTWIGAVVENNDYGHLAIKVLLLLHCKFALSYISTHTKDKYVWTHFLFRPAFYRNFRPRFRGKGVCLEFIRTVSEESIERDALRAARAIQASTARVIVIVCWYTYVKAIFLELAKRNVSN